MIPITVQVLKRCNWRSSAEVIARVIANDQQAAVDKLMSTARCDDYYYRFLSSNGVLSPALFDAKLEHNGATWFARYHRY